MKKKRIRILVNIVNKDLGNPNGWAFNETLTKHPFIIVILA